MASDCEYLQVLLSGPAYGVLSEIVNLVRNSELSGQTEQDRNTKDSHKHVSDFWRDRTHLAVQDSLLSQSCFHPVTLLQGEQGRGPQVDEALPGVGDADHEE